MENNKTYHGMYVIEFVFEFFQRLISVVNFFRNENLTKKNITTLTLIHSTNNKKPIIASEFHLQIIEIGTCIMRRTQYAAVYCAFIGPTSAELSENIYGRVSDMIEL